MPTRLALVCGVPLLITRIACIKKTLFAAIQVGVVTALLSLKRLAASLATWLWQTLVGLRSSAPSRLVLGHVRGTPRFSEGNRALWRAALCLAYVCADVGKLLAAVPTSCLLSNLNPAASLSCNVPLQLVAVGATLTVFSSSRLPIRTAFPARH
jgi:hypothetical protein